MNNDQRIVILVDELVRATTKNLPRGVQKGREYQILERLGLKKLYVPLHKERTNEINR